jgi:PTS system nitrogen regulatory IIA component
MTMPLAQLIRPDLIFPDLPDTSASRILRLFAERVASLHGLDAEALFESLTEREALGSTGIGGGVAIPHCRVAGLQASIVAVGTALQGIDFGAVDARPVRVFFVIVSPKDDPSQNLRCLAEVSRWVKEPGNVERLLDQPSRLAIMEALIGEPSLGRDRR